MFWYLLNVFIIVLAWLWPQNCFGRDAETVLQRRKKCVCIVATLNWIILSGCRGLSVGADTFQYKVGHFDVTLNKSWESIFTNIYLKYVMNVAIKDPGYALFEKVFQIFSKDYQVYLIAVAIIFFVPLGILIYRKSSNPCMSYILFSALFFSFFAITGIRQTIATSIVVFGGIYLIENRKPVKFIFLSLLASMIHQSALCFIPFYWLSQIKINKVSLSAYWVAIVAAFVLRYQFLALLKYFVGYDGYLDGEGAAAGTFVFLLIILAVFVTCFSKKIVEQNDPFIQTAINGLMLSCVFSSLLLINPAFMRVVQYYSLFMMFVLPACSRVFQTGKSRMLYYFIVNSVLILLLAIKPHTYVFFWQ